MRTLLRQASETLFKKKDVFGSSIYAPDVLLQNGQKVRIRKQMSGFLLDAYFVISGVEYIFESSPDQSTGTFHYGIKGGRFVAFN